MTKAGIRMLKGRGLKGEENQIGNAGFFGAEQWKMVLGTQVSFQPDKVDFGFQIRLAFPQLKPASRGNVYSSG